MSGNLKRSFIDGTVEYFFQGISTDGIGLGIPEQVVIDLPSGTNFQISFDDVGKLIVLNGQALTPKTVSLPRANTVPRGGRYQVIAKNVSAPFQVTIVCAGPDTLQGSVALDTAGELTYFQGETQIQFGLSLNQEGATVMFESNGVDEWYLAAGAGEFETVV
jgi:hypothetical protein